jgi:hypothetical protein
LELHFSNFGVGELRVEELHLVETVEEVLVGVVSQDGETTDNGLR